jgi:hypothetical protein
MSRIHYRRLIAPQSRGDFFVFYFKKRLIFATSLGIGV